MKKTYTKKQITEAIAYWEKQLAKGNYRKVNESDNHNANGKIDILQLAASKAGVTVEQLIHAAICKACKETDALEKAGFSDAKYFPCTLYLDFEEDVNGHFEDYGIGAYEYWGSSGYDSNIGFEIESGGLDEDLMSNAGNAVAEALFGEGAEYDLINISDEIDPDNRVQRGNVSIATGVSPDDMEESCLDDMLQNLKPYLGKKSEYFVQVYK